MNESTEGLSQWDSGVYVSMDNTTAKVVVSDADAKLSNCQRFTFIMHKKP